MSLLSLCNVIDKDLEQSDLDINFLLKQLEIDTPHHA